MLLAEIHGKGVHDLEGLEDLITSSVFGHLRLVKPPSFWLAVFERAHTVEQTPRTLFQVLSQQGINASMFSEVKIRFWPNFPNYGEPDLLIEFFGESVASITILIEVKLHAGKSGTDEYDQLTKYFALLNDPACFPHSRETSSHRYLVYLTKIFSTEDLHSSVKKSKISDAESHMFGLEWNDILEVAIAERDQSPLLDEVAKFLTRRGFGKFNGFKFSYSEKELTGCFYQRRFFEQVQIGNTSGDGRFYGVEPR